MITEKLEKIKPLLEPKRSFAAEKDLVFVLGGECFSGSMKSISAFGCIHTLLEELGEDSFEGKTLIDASSGNFGRALAAFGEYLNIPVEVVVSTKATEITKKLISLHGATLSVGGDTTLECYETVKSKVQESPDKYLLVGQLDNWGNPNGHMRISGPNLNGLLSNTDNLFLAMGSGGGINGITRYCREHFPHVRVFASVAAPGSKIVGTYSDGIDYETPFIQQLRLENMLAAEVAISDTEAVEAMVTLRKEYGLFLGYSSGGVYAAYQKAQEDGLVTGRTLIISWDGGEKWIDKLGI